MEQTPPLNTTADRPTSYDAFPRVVSTPEGRVWLAWCSLRDRRDEICVRSFDPSKDTGALSPVEVVSQGGAVNFWPTLLRRDYGTLEVVWGTHRAGRWEVRARQCSPDGVWAPEAACIARDAWQPTATLDNAGALWVASTNASTREPIPTRRAAAASMLRAGWCRYVIPLHLLGSRSPCPVETRRVLWIRSPGPVGGDRPSL